MSFATAAAIASPQVVAIRCSDKSIPAVTPALDANAPSSTNTRLSTTCACGASARNSASSSWCVVQRRAPSRPARAASSVPEQIVTRRCGDASASSSGRIVRLSHRTVASIALSARARTSSGWPTSMSQVGESSWAGKGSSAASCRPTELSVSALAAV